HTLYLLGEPDQRAEPTQREYARAYRHRSHHDQGLGPERRTVAVTRPGAVSLNHDRTTSLNTMSCGEWDASESNRPRPRGRAPGACVPATSVAEGLEAVRSRHRLHFLISRSLRTRAALMRLEWALSLFLIAFLLISRPPASPAPSWNFISHRRSGVNRSAADGPRVNRPPRRRHGQSMITNSRTSSTMVRSSMSPLNLPPELTPPRIARPSLSR